LRIWPPYALEGEREGAAVLGDEGYVVIGNSRWRAFDAQGQQVADDTDGGDTTAAHAENFLASMRSRQKPAADLESGGPPSSLLCHLGNAAWRAGRTLRFHPQAYTFIDDEEANQTPTRPGDRPPSSPP